nr:MAG TPA: GIY-YIG nuclease superfamily protein [Caudoviricetes sp.]
MHGESNPFYGKHHTETTKQKMREAKNNVSGENNPMYGKLHSEETKEKIRQKKLGSHMSLETKLKISTPIKCVETEEIYVSTKEASRKLNLDSGAIGKCCRGKISTYRGLHWVYPTEEELNEFFNITKKRNEMNNSND